MVFKTNYRLMQVKSNAECSKGSILQYFQPSLSYHLSLRYFFCLFLSACLTQVLLYAADRTTKRYFRAKNSGRIKVKLQVVSLQYLPGGVAQSVTCLATDACLTADPGVASSIPARSHTFVEIDHEIISTVILPPSADSLKKGCCQVQAKVCAQITG